jgi:hypothetical protein
VPVGPKTLLRTATWWVAFGLLLHDLHASYDGARIGEQEREAMLHRMAAIDWSLGNPDFSFLGNSVEAKDTGQKPVDDQGRPVVNQFFGGAKAYYNLAAYIRQLVGIKAKVNYGSEYGTSLTFNDDGSIAVPASRSPRPCLPADRGPCQFALAGPFIFFMPLKASES